jgi:hypothetical protein
MQDPLLQRSEMDRNRLPVWLRGADNPIPFPYLMKPSTVKLSTTSLYVVPTCRLLEATLDTSSAFGLLFCAKSTLSASESPCLWLFTCFHPPSVLADAGCLSVTTDHDRLLVRPLINILRTTGVAKLHLDFGGLHSVLAFEETLCHSKQRFSVANVNCK